ncbi:MAG: signal recognition particle protein [Alphaproteobacteria bacterium]
MFDTLQERLGGVLDGLTKRGALSEADVDAALREVRVALLEADVALPVARKFIKDVREEAIGAGVLKSVSPGQMVIKIVHDELVKVLGGDPALSRDADAPEAVAAGLNLNAVPPVPVLMVGLQGSGKTTSTAKIAYRLQQRDKKKVLMASLDTRRPAAMEQLRVLGEQTGVDVLPIVEGQQPVDIANRAMNAGRLSGYDVVLLDTAGRMHVEEGLMAEVSAVRDAVKPQETLLVADSLTGQDAVNVAQQFNERVGVTGIVLTRVDGDGRGGAALSMRAVTGCPIKLLGVGEKFDALEDFHPTRMAGRILGMGDIVSLVEKAAETMEAEQAARMAKKFAKGQFDMNDLREHIQQVQKMGGMGGILNLLPGIGKMKKQLDQLDMDESVFKRQEAIINSMTKKERLQPKLLQASRKKRIAAGSGTTVQEVNKLIKMHRQMADMMKKMSKGKGLMSAMGAAMGMPNKSAMPSPEDMEQLAQKMGGPQGGGMGGGMGGPGGLPGLGAPGGLPPGFPGSGKK